LVPLAFSMTAYTYGSLFGLLWLSLFVAPRRIHFPVLGVVISITAVTALSMTDAVAFPWLFPVGVVLSVGFALLPLKNPKS
ncbi:MAG: hypothetical protein ACO3IL_10095, partial [Steroidobacteraceae bacterium]